MTDEFQSLTAMFEQQVTQTPYKVAVSCGVHDITYRDLNDKANQVAHFLKGHGIDSEALVALYLDRSVEFIIVLLGALKCGGAYVPIDSGMPAERVNAILSDCQPVVVITNQELRGHINVSVPTLVNIDTDWSIIEKESARKLYSEVFESSLLNVIYTSGLTGHPKAVLGIYQGISNRLRWANKEYPYQAQEIACQRISISFVDHIAEIFAPLLKGVTLVILSNAQANNAEELLLALSRKKITRMVVSPSLLKSVLSVPKELAFHLPQLKYVFCSGEPLSTALAGLFYQRFKYTRLINVYGATEVSADATWYEVKRSDVDSVLAYFSKSIDFLPDINDNDSLPASEHLIKNDITAPDILVNDLAKHFTQTQMAEYPTSLTQYFDWFNEEVLPYSINTASPLYIGHMTSALPDFVHDMSKLISKMNQNLVKIETAKSAIFVEREALAMLHRCFYELSDDFYNKYVQKVNTNLGLVTTGGTISNITALMIARNRALSQLVDGGDLSSSSIYSILQSSGYKDLVILGSRLMHYSMKKSASVLGLGTSNIIHIDFGVDGALDIADLSSKLDYCKKNKLFVFAIVGIAGATETGHIDPLQQMADVADKHDIYFHVDAAWGGTGLFSDKYRHRFKGIERANSVTFCAHKQLYLPQGISVCLFRDPEELEYGATTAVYQSTPDSYDVGRFSMEGSRSALALLLHASLQLIGQKGYEALFDASVDKSVFFADIINSMDSFELIFEPVLNIVNYRYIPEAYRQKLKQGDLTSDDHQAINEINQQLQETQFLRGLTFVSKTILTNTGYGVTQAIVVFRVILANPLTTQADIFQVIEEQLLLANEICGDKNSVEIQGSDRHGSSLADAFSDSIVLKKELEQHLIPLGKPLPNCQIYILDENMLPVADNEAGEIYIGGLAVSRAYFHKEDHGSRFSTNPFSDQFGGRIFRTGDRGKKHSNGNIEYLGRNDDLIKMGEYRVELSELESTLLEIDNIKHCAVTAHNDEQGDKYLVAHIELNELLDHTKQLKGIQESARKKLQSHMIPSEYRILDHMPFTLGGKINRKLLSQLNNTSQ